MITWSPGMTLDGLEKAVIKSACKFYPSKTATAQALGISIRTLDNKLERYAQDDKSERDFEHERRVNAGRELARARGESYVPEPVRRDARIDDAERAHRLAQSRGITPAPGATHMSEAGRGVRVESPVTITAKQSVSVPERAEVQSVLPKETAQVSAKGSRR